MTGHTDWVGTLVKLPNGSIASGSSDSTVKICVRIWNPNTGSLIYCLIGHTAAIWTLATLPNGNLASCSDDKTVKIWNPNTGKL